MPQSKQPFPCNGCGKCCRQVSNSAETAWLDRGDSVCMHFNEHTNLCSIYENRPLVCQVEAYYDKYLSEKFAWEQFIEINLRICKKLNDTF